MSPTLFAARRAERSHLNMISRRRKFMARTILYLWMGWMLIVWCAMNNFQYSCPRSPVLAEGRIYPFNNHGVVTYLTRTEYVLTEGLWFWYGVIGVLYTTIVKRQGWDRDDSN
jgi:hypothetical protein